MEANDEDIATVRHLLQDTPQRQADRQRLQKDLLRVAANGFADACRAVLADPLVNVNCHTQHGMTPLHYAALNNHIDVVTLLLEAGANHNAETTKGLRPLDLARQKGHGEVVALLEAHDDRPPKEDVLAQKREPLTKRFSMGSLSGGVHAIAGAQDPITFGSAHDLFGKPSPQITTPTPSPRGIRRVVSASSLPMLTSSPDPDIIITVRDPKDAGPWYDRHVVYSVQFIRTAPPPSRYQVERRFSDFLSLFEAMLIHSIQLKDTHTVARLETLRPTKVYMANRMDPTILQRRQQQFEALLTLGLSSPLLNPFVVGFVFDNKYLASNSKIVQKGDSSPTSRPTTLSSCPTPDSNLHTPEGSPQTQRKPRSQSALDTPSTSFDQPRLPQNVRNFSRTPTPDGPRRVSSTPISPPVRPMSPSPSLVRSRAVTREIIREASEDHA